MLKIKRSIGYPSIRVPWYKRKNILETLTRGLKKVNQRLKKISISRTVKSNEVYGEKITNSTILEKTLLSLAENCDSVVLVIEDSNICTFSMQACTILFDEMDKREIP